MFRYMAMLWDGNDPQGPARACSAAHTLRQSSAAWREVLQTPGCRLLCTEATAQRVCLLDGQAGSILGSCWQWPRDPFEDSAPPPFIATSEATRAILASNGEHLIRHAWGNYVAMLLLPAGATLVLSPTGNLPCLVMAGRGLTFVFSCVADVTGLRGPALQPAHLYVRDRVLGRPIGSSTALPGLTRLTRGESLRIEFRPRSGTHRQLLWSPLRFSECDAPLEDADTAARAMRATLRACTRALAAEHAHVLLRLSGGLDSSIIAGCLAHLPSRTSVTAHTYWPGDNAADVRPWARRAAQHASFPLIETPTGPEHVRLESLTSLQRTPDVTSFLEFAGRSALERALCAQTGATAVFTGDGGDSGFCSDSITLVVHEYLKRHGLTPHAVRLATQLARYTHRTTWQETQRAYQRWRQHEPTDRANVQRCVSQLVCAELRRQSSRGAGYEHPWFAAAEIPWASIFRMGMLVLPPTYYDLAVPADVFAPEILQPLHAQPVIELLLRIPPYVHFENGRERGLARRTFAGDAPAENLRREWKDRAPHALNEIIDRNRTWLRELFLDGLLVRDHLLDRNALDAALSAAPAKSTLRPGELFHLLDIELWVRQWTGNT